MEEKGLTPEVAPVAEQQVDNTEVAVETAVETPQVSDAQAEDSQTEPANEYAGKSKAELVEMLATALAERAVQQLRTTVEAIKINFYKLHRADVETARASFVEAGGNGEEFTPESDELEVKFKGLISDYRTKRDEYVANIETEKENNYKAKIAIIEEIKELTNSGETLNNTFTTFRELQNRWKEIGIVPQEKIKDLWDTYHHHVENFYNFIKINKELRDLDLRRNYEAKLVLCEEAEALMLEPSAVNAFHKLQKLHEQWREIGPVSLEFKDQIWERFKEASTRVNKRHQDYFDGIKEEQERNLQLKEELCIKVEEFLNQPFTTRREWSDASDAIAEIQKVWKTIGFAPKRENTVIYERFRAACDKFFEAKREYFGGLKSELDDNLQVKVDLCIQAEAISESEDWKAATDAIIELQKKWKQSGAVARKYADDVWKRFRAACDKFFERKAEHFNNVDSKFNENLEAKKQLLKELAEALEDKANLTFDKIKEFQRRWSEVGFVPIKYKEAIANEYKELVDKIFAHLRAGEGERRIERFKERITSIKDGGKGRIGSERDKLFNKVRGLEDDIKVWQNNIGFFARSKNADALVKEVEKKIAKAKAEIAETIEKIKMIDNN
ncbi:hypothetical protein BN938_1652 [Mucinivorans hirudinis]|uniref:DUF349 domain-containing protein n=1 Tax=Mucinivorans hirudinis TaxID=1433126 RepID=A0A060R8G3_9BACT|nr:hypothetical protein BN938_1652 [Mucinivorans hirudinis]